MMDKQMLDVYRMGDKHLWKACFEADYHICDYYCGLWVTIDTHGDGFLTPEELEADKRELNNPDRVNDVVNWVFSHFPKELHFVGRDKLTALVEQRFKFYDL